MKKYKTASSFKTAHLERIKNIASNNQIQTQRLQKQVAWFIQALK